MRRKKYPNCGETVERQDKFCPNCGQELHQVKKVKSSTKIKALWASTIAILATGVIVAVGIYHLQENQRARNVVKEVVNTTKSKKTSAKKTATKKSKKPVKITSEDLDHADYMLMVYMNYAEANYRQSRGTDSLPELIDTVKSDIKAKRLTIKLLDRSDLYKVEN